MGAQSRLDDVIDSVVRDSISSTNLAQIVRSSDWSGQEVELPVDVEMAVPEGEDVVKGRQDLERRIFAEASAGWGSTASSWWTFGSSG
jgi:membrane protease subunit HflC